MELKAKVTLVKIGYGELTLNDSALIWHKTVRHFLAFGVLGGISANELVIPLSDIAGIGTYVYTGGGLKVMLKDHRKYKIGFNRQSDYRIFYNRLDEMLNKI